MTLQEFARVDITSNLGKAVEKTSYYYQIQVDNDNIEQKLKVIKVCGTLASIVTLQLGVPL